MAFGLVAGWLFLRDKIRGSLDWLGMAAYGVFRFLAQWFRPNYDLNNATGGWNTGHTLALALCLVGFAGLVWTLVFPSGTASKGRSAESPSQP